MEKDAHIYKASQEANHPFLLRMGQVLTEKNSLMDKLALPRANSLP